MAVTDALGPPVDPRDFADPFVLRVGTVYYAYATQAGATNVQVMRSTDLVAWEHLGDALPHLPAWAGPGRTWAPAVLRRGRRFVLYVTVREPGRDLQAVAAAVAPRPEGPFTAAGDGPLVYQPARGGSIDPSPFVDRDGAAYLLWKSDDNARQRPSSLWGRRLAADGLGFAGEAVELLRHDRDWERPLVEAPALVRHRDTYVLFYSANWWESARYAIGYATAPAPLGPYRKVTTAGPWVASGPLAAGPGGQELFTDAAGRRWMACHAWSPGVVGYAGGGARSLRLARVRFTDGRPQLRA